MDAFAEAMGTFQEKLQTLVNTHAAERFPDLPYYETIEFQDGRVFSRIVTKETPKDENAPAYHTRTAAYGFVALKDGNTKGLGAFKQGDVFMAAGWKAPAKHVRGTIFDEDITTFCGPHGVNYLK